MTKKINNEQMANIRQSLAEAGIYFDKLYIHQAYFNSQITVHPPTKKSRKTPTSLWQKLFCGMDTKRTSIATQTALTVRDDREINPPSRQRLVPTQNIYDRRRCRPSHRDYRPTKEQQPLRHRPSSVATRSVLASQYKAKMASNDTDDDDADNEFAV